tara:strand:+ start:938 stop:1063 length:126 start_codon:yes stop_codon:yes gene_type:complete
MLRAGSTAQGTQFGTVMAAVRNRAIGETEMVVENRLTCVDV